RTVPGAPSVLSGTSATNAAASGETSVSITSSPLGSEVELTTTITASTTLLLVFSPQSTTRTLALGAEQLYPASPKLAIPASEQFTSTGLAAAEKTCGPSGTFVPRISTVHAPTSGFATYTCSMLSRWFSAFCTAGSSGIA